MDERVDLVTGYDGDVSVRLSDVVCYGRTAPEDPEAVWLSGGQVVALRDGECDKIREALRGPLKVPAQARVALPSEEEQERRERKGFQAYMLSTELRALEVPPSRASVVWRAAWRDASRWWKDVAQGRGPAGEGGGR